MLATATTAFDVGFNREVLGDAGRYFSTPAELAAIIEEEERDASTLHTRAQSGFRRSADYSWDDVADRYESLCLRLAGRRTESAFAIEMNGASRC